MRRQGLATLLQQAGITAPGGSAGAMDLEGATGAALGERAVRGGGAAQVHRVATLPWVAAAALRPRSEASSLPRCCAPPPRALLRDAGAILGGLATDCVHVASVSSSS